MEGVPSLESPQPRDWLIQLPEDVLWTVLGFLDLPTLHTARLVCKCFRRSASEHFKTLDCTAVAGLPTTDFTQFSAMRYLAVTVCHESQLQSLAHPRIAPIATHVSLKNLHLQDSQIAMELEDVLMHLPKLRSVSVQPLPGDSRLPLFPALLKELKITNRQTSPAVPWAGLGDASPLARCSQLTSLAVDLAVGAGSSIGSLSSLRNLRSLDLCSCSSALGLLSTFTALTSLTFVTRGNVHGEVRHMFQDLGHLTGLSQLAVSVLSVWSAAVMPADLVCIAQLRNLTCLDMSGCWLAYEVRGSSALVPLTRLVSVRFSETSGMPRLSSQQVKALQSLSLEEVSGVSILRSATGLTHLRLSWRDPSTPWRNPAPEPSSLCAALAGMANLRSLEISFLTPNWEDHQRAMSHVYPSCLDNGRGWLEGVLPACTMLTKLHFCGKLRPESDLPACAALPGLRSLSLDSTRDLTPAWLPALQAMTGLTELSLDWTGVCMADMTPDVVAAFDAERRQLGWPLLNLRVKDWGRTCFERLER